MSEPPTDTRTLVRTPPRVKSFTEPYWNATRERKLLIQFCTRSGQPQFFPRPTSIVTGRRELEWREVDGTGELESWTTIRRAGGELRGHEPYVIASVQLDVGVMVLGELVDCAPDDIQIGMRLGPTWGSFSDGAGLLMFRPLDGA